MSNISAFALSDKTCEKVASGSTLCNVPTALSTRLGLFVEGFCSLTVTFEREHNRIKTNT